MLRMDGLLHRGAIALANDSVGPEGVVVVVCDDGDGELVHFDESGLSGQRALPEIPAPTSTTAPVAMDTFRNSRRSSMVFIELPPLSVTLSEPEQLTESVTTRRRMSLSFHDSK